MCCFPLYLLKHINAGIDDLFNVMSELLPVLSKWKHIGLALGLDHSELKMIERENRDNLQDCLTEVLTLWLNKAYNTEIFGEPSWELLVRAVANPAGGNNSALAEEIVMNCRGICMSGYLVLALSSFAKLEMHGSRWLSQSPYYA